jgi:hypothetical protein
MHVSVRSASQFTSFGPFNASELVPSLTRNEDRNVATDDPTNGSDDDKLIMHPSSEDCCESIPFGARYHLLQPTSCVVFPCHQRSNSVASLVKINQYDGHMHIMIHNL